MLSNSWVIIKRDTQEAVLETWNNSILQYLKPEFKAIPTHEYLINFNRKTNEENCRLEKE